MRITYDDPERRVPTHPDIQSLPYDRRRRYRMCWIWRGAVDANGYPRLRYGNTSIYLHRDEYIHTRGPLAPRQRIYRLCGDRRCINAYHASTEEPAFQRRARLRRRPGTAKLTRRQAASIRKQWRRKDRPTQRELAERYGVSRSAISLVVRRLTWT